MRQIKLSRGGICENPEKSKLRGGRSSMAKCADGQKARLAAAVVYGSSSAASAPDVFTSHQVTPNDPGRV